MTAQVRFGRPSGNYQLASNWQPPISNSITQDLNLPYHQTVYQPAYVQQPQPQFPNDGRYTLINTTNTGLPGYASNYRPINQPINRQTNSTVVAAPQQTYTRQPEVVQQTQRPDYTKTYQTNLPNKKLGPDTDPAIKSSCCSPWWWLLLAILALVALVLALLFGLGVFGVNKPIDSSAKQPIDSSANSKPVDNSTNGGTNPIINPNTNNSSANLNGGKPTPTGETSVSPTVSTTKAPKEIYNQPQTAETPASVPPEVVPPIRSPSDPATSNPSAP